MNEADIKQYISKVYNGGKNSGNHNPGQGRGVGKPGAGAGRKTDYVGSKKDSISALASKRKDLQNSLKNLDENSKEYKEIQDKLTKVETQLKQEVVKSCFSDKKFLDKMSKSVAAPFGYNDAFISAEIREGNWGEQVVAFNGSIIDSKGNTIDSFYTVREDTGPYGDNKEIGTMGEVNRTSDDKTILSYWYESPEKNEITYRKTS